MDAEPFDRWREQVYSGRSERWNAGRDLSFWEQGAPRYDQQQPALPQTVAWLRGELAGLGSLLEVGAGTGRLLLPLADVLPRVTALDYSPHMLGQLRAKAPPAHVRTVCRPLEDVLSDPAFEPHDAVLSAWSLAYQPELAPALRGLRRLARRTLYLLEDDGVGSPHVNLRRELAASPRPQRASLLRGALNALGWSVTVRRITEERALTLPDTAALLALCRLPLSEAEVLAALSPYLTSEGTGWHYRWTFDVWALRVEAGA